MANKKSGVMREFVSFSGGQVSMFVITEDAAPELRRLAEEYPELINRALRHLAWRIKEEISRGIRRQGVDGAKWAKRSLMHIYRRADMARNHGGERASQYLGLKHKDQKNYRGLRKGDDTGKAWRERRRDDMVARWKAPGGSKGLRGEGAMIGRIAAGLRYKQTGQGRYEIGALNAGTAQALELAQSERSTPISDKMRKFFWAAGIPLGKGKTVISQPRRELVDAVYRKMEPHFEDILMTRLNSYLEGASGANAESFKLS